MTNEELQTLLLLDRSKLPSDGRPNYNRLIFSSSPYLLQHAENPVNWQEWGKSARDEAKRRNLPLFVSIGYSTCHWCHVMAHESFEDEDIADILNNAFVPVKIDREERPDLDEFCMAACQTLTGSGGWPLNCFLKPDGTPFYALTYLPKEPRNGMPGFLELLENITHVWKHRQDSVERNAESLMDALKKSLPDEVAESKLPDFKILAAEGAETLSRIYDKRFKGFGNAPKFPMPLYLLFLIGSNKDEERKMAVESLKAMRSGGIWDQLGGGIHRYSTDRAWFAPHFEKMLYDQALVAYSAFEAYSTTKDPELLEIAENILEFSMDELCSPGGGFYCGLDADSEGAEGSCYLWRLSELEELLGDNAPLFADFYGVTGKGNFENHGENILYQAISIENLADKHNLEIDSAKISLDIARKTVLDARNERVQPLLDLKILSGWNGLMIAALAKGAAITGNRLWLDAAMKARDFIMERMRRPDGRLIRSHLHSRSEIPGFIEDYSFTTWGLLELFKATNDSKYLNDAENLAAETLRLFQSPDGRYLFSGSDFEQMPLPGAGIYDGVIPSGISVHFMNMLILADETGNIKWQTEAEKLLLCYKKKIASHPSASLFLVRTGAA